MKRIKTKEDLIKAMELSVALKKDVESFILEEQISRMEADVHIIRDEFIKGNLRMDEDPYIITMEKSEIMDCIIETGCYDSHIFDNKSVYRIDENYSDYGDRTFILADNLDNMETISIGWYYGKPCGDATDSAINMYRAPETEKNDAAMSNDDGQLAILFTDDHFYYYYIMEETVIRVSDNLEIKSNAFWEYDILTDDLANEEMEIDFLSDYLTDMYLTDDEFKEYYEDKYDHVIEKVKKYSEDHK